MRCLHASDLLRQLSNSERLRPQPRHHPVFSSSLQIPVHGLDPLIKTPLTIGPLLSIGPLSLPLKLDYILPLGINWSKFLANKANNTFVFKVAEKFRLTRWFRVLLIYGSY